MPPLIEQLAPTLTGVVDSEIRTSSLASQPSLSLSIQCLKRSLFYPEPASGRTFSSAISTLKSPSGAVVDASGVDSGVTATSLSF